MVVLKAVRFLKVIPIVIETKDIYKKKTLKISKQTSRYFNLGYRVKASTLMETLIATVLIVVVFMLASMILNNLFSNTIKSNTRNVEAYLNELQYLYNNEKLSLPYYNDYKQWNVSITMEKNGSQNIILYEAENSKTNQKILKETIEK